MLGVSARSFAWNSFAPLSPPHSSVIASCRRKSNVTKRILMLSYVASSVHVLGTSSPATMPGTLQFATPNLPDDS